MKVSWYTYLADLLANSSTCYLVHGLLKVKEFRNSHDSVVDKKYSCDPQILCIVSTLKLVSEQKLYYSDYVPLPTYL